MTEPGTPADGGADRGDQPTEPLISMGNSDRCATCGAEMTPDQRYCVECGTRRGKARFSLGAAAATPALAAGTVGGPAPGRHRFSPNSTLLIGLAILLLALGIGVLIGSSNSSPAETAKAPTVIVNGGGGGTGAVASNNTPTTSSNSTGNAKASKTGVAAPKKVSSSSGNLGGNIDQSKLHTKKQRTAAAKSYQSQQTSLGNGKKLASQTTTVGSKCSAGTVGCQNGVYTGNYFGSGG